MGNCSPAPEPVRPARGDADSELVWPGAEVSEGTRPLPYNWEMCVTAGPNPPRPYYFKDHASQRTYWEDPRRHPHLVSTPPASTRYWEKWQVGDLCEINFRGRWYGGVVVGVRATKPRLFDVVFDELPGALSRTGSEALPGAASVLDSSHYRHWGERACTTASSRLVPSLHGWHLRFPKKVLGPRGAAVFRSLNSLDECSDADDTGGVGGPQRNIDQFGRRVEAEEPPPSPSTTAAAAGGCSGFALRWEGPGSLGISFSVAAPGAPSLTEVTSLLAANNGDCHPMTATFDLLHQQVFLAAVNQVDVKELPIDAALNVVRECGARNRTLTFVCVPRAGVGTAKGPPRLRAAAAAVVSKKAVAQMRQRWKTKCLSHGFVSHVQEDGGVVWLYERRPALNTTQSAHPRAGSTFAQKRAWFYTEVERVNLPWARGQGQGWHKISVRRGHELGDTMAAVARFSHERRDWHKPWRVSYRGEQGLDAGGLTRALFTELTRQIFSIELGAFAFSGVDHICYQLNPASETELRYPPSAPPKGSAAERHIAFFGFVGRLLAKALLMQNQISVHLTRPLYKHLVGSVVQVSLRISSLLASRCLLSVPAVLFSANLQVVPFLHACGEGSFTTSSSTIPLSTAASRLCASGPRTAASKTRSASASKTATARRSHPAARSSL